jgi:hypothetical protein
MSTRFSQNRICCLLLPSLLLPSLCVLTLLLGWSATAGADPLRRIDQIQAAMAAPKAPDMGAFAGQAPARSGLLRRRPSGAFPPGPPLAMPSFSTGYVRDGISFPLTVIGTDPARGLTTTIPTVIFAYRLQLADGTVFDASSDVIDGVTPVQGVLASPIFTPAPWDRRRLGITQWSDAVMRANFAERMADGYHVLLGTPTVVPITVDVPAAAGVSFVDPKSGVLLAAIDAAWLLDLNIQVTQSHGIPPTTLPIHLFSQVETAAFGHGISDGFHTYSVFTTSSGATLAAPLIQAGYFSKAQEISNGRAQGQNTGVLAHEVAEWLMDPTVSNVTMAWQNPAQPGVCNSPVIEVGDPLEAIAPGVDVEGYRFPDVALLPWFTGSQVLRSVNHQFSLFGTLTRRSAICPDYSNYVGYLIGFTGVDTTQFSGVNNQHQVVGFLTVGNGLHSFVLSNVDPIAGTPITVSLIYVPGSLVTIAQGINDAGNVVGIYLDSQGKEHGFLLQGTLYAPIDFPGAVATEALGTNKHGDIVGDYTDGAGMVHGFAFMNGRFREVDAPFADSGLTVTGINDSRIVVGTYGSGGNTASFSGPLENLQPFNFPQVSPLDLRDFPVAYATFAAGINNSRQIAGYVFVGGVFVSPYVATAGLFQAMSLGSDFDGAQSSPLGAINDSGVAVGSLTDHSGTFGILLVPGTAQGLPFQRMMIAPP